MSSTIPRPLLEIRYDESARDYLASLPAEPHMEAPPQATQREITVESFAVLKLRRPEVQYFNDLLVQYPIAPSVRKKGSPASMAPSNDLLGQRLDQHMEQTRQVVPDNMVVLHDGALRVGNSFARALQPVGPFLVLEYVVRGCGRKDYEDSFRKYERELKVPYFLLFYHDEPDLTLFRHDARKYVSVKPNDAGRLAIPELDLEVALLDGWARYWYRGELLQLPGDLQTSLDEAREATRRAEAREADLRRQKEKLLAQLKALGVEPDL